jgi:hypothetical protein
MDKTTLVADDREIEALVVAALSHAKIPVTAVEWSWMPHTSEWQLVVITSMYDSKGPRHSYSRILEALSSAGVYQRIPIRKLFVKSPADPYAQELIRQLKLRTEGSIHILRNGTKPRQPKYAVVFAPYLGSGGPIPSVRLEGEADLRHFLQKRLGIADYDVDDALSQLAKKGHASIFNVQLNLRRAKRLNLAA